MIGDRTKRRRLRELIRGGRLVVAPGAHDGLTAKLIERAGFPAVYMTGSGVANAPVRFCPAGFFGIEHTGSPLGDWRKRGSRLKHGLEPRWSHYRPTHSRSVMQSRIDGWWHLPADDKLDPAVNVRKSTMFSGTSRLLRTPRAERHV